MAQPSVGSGSLLAGLVAGCICGAALARLYTPCSGVALRSRLRSQSQDLIVGTCDRINNLIGQAQFYGEDALSLLRPPEALDS